MKDRYLKLLELAKEAADVENYSARMDDKITLLQFNRAANPQVIQELCSTLLKYQEALQDILDTSEHTEHRCYFSGIAREALSETVKS